MTQQLVSMTPTADGQPHSAPFDPLEIIAGIAGDQWRSEVTSLRDTYTAARKKWVPGQSNPDNGKVFEDASDYARSVVATAKKKLPGIMWSGVFNRRGAGGLESYSGLICADLDHLKPDELALARLNADLDPHVWCAFISPTGEGLKLVFRVGTTEERHGDAFAAMSAHVLKVYGLAVDQACKNLERLCFVSHDPDAYWREAELLPVPDDPTITPAKTISTSTGQATVQPSVRARIAAEMFGPSWEIGGKLFVKCPNEVMHTTGTNPRECELHLDGAPNIDCKHSSCKVAEKEINKELCSRIGKAENASPKMKLRGQPFKPRNGARHDYLPGEDEAQAETETKTNSLPEIRDACDFVAVELPEPSQLIAGMLHQGCKLVVGGGSKSFKTWTLLDLALSVAYGRPWLGRKTAQGRVLYVNFEIQDHAWQRRIVSVSGAKHIQPSSGNLLVWNLRGKATDYRQLLPPIIAEASKHGLALIVLDPIYKIYGAADENKASDVAALLNALESLAVKTGAAVAFGAHYAKGNASQKEAIDRISGSGVFARDPDTIINFTRHEEEDAFTIETILRNLPPVPAFVVQWQFPLMQLAEDLDPEKLKQIGGRKKEHSGADLLRTLPPNGLKNAEWESRANEEDGISRASFYRLRKQLEKEGKVMFSNANSKWMPVSKPQNDSNHRNHND